MPEHLGLLKLIVRGIITAAGFGWEELPALAAKGIAFMLPDFC
jgi:hypothetical protein